MLSDLKPGCYRKKPVEIQAVQLIAAKAGQPRQLGPTNIPDWYSIAQMRGIIVNATDAEGNEIDGLFINTLEGVHHASPGDWIIQGVKGELYPCKPDIFAMTYEPAAQPSGDMVEVAQSAFSAMLRVNSPELLAEAFTAAMQPHLAQASLQARVALWMDACFGPEISNDRLERGDRFAEEALELLQSGGYPKERAYALIEYVYGREIGEPVQEVGGVMVTLAAYCLAHGLDMHEAGETELARIWTKVDAIRAKQAAKPTGSALPTAAVDPIAQAKAEGVRIGLERAAAEWADDDQEWTGPEVANAIRALDPETSKPACPYCGGCGEHDASGSPCMVCHGRGVVDQENTLQAENAAIKAELAEAREIMGDLRSHQSWSNLKPTPLERLTAYLDKEPGQ